jgi:hypothetical protein
MLDLWRLNMPVHRTTKGGKPGFQWGNTGKVYVYKSGDAASRKTAKKKAIKQGVAVSYSTKKIHL